MRKLNRGHGGLKRQQLVDSGALEEKNSRNSWLDK